MSVTQDDQQPQTMAVENQPQASASEQPVQADTKEGKRLGMGTFAASATGGIAAGLGAQKLAVDASVKKNLAQPFTDGVADVMKQIDTSYLGLGNPAAQEIVQNAEYTTNVVRESAFHSVYEADTPVIRALENPDTLLGAARKSVTDSVTVERMGDQITDPKGRRFSEKLNRLTEAQLTKINEQAGKIAGAADRNIRETEARKMLELIEKNSRQLDEAWAAEKVSRIPWFRRLEPFSKDLHLTGKQKGLAFAAGLATMVGSITGIAYAISALKGSSKDTGAER